MKCPHCLVAIHVNWLPLFWNEDLVKSSVDADGSWSLTHADCPSCRKLLLRLHFTALSGEIRSRFVNPISMSRPVHPEVPSEFASDFREACLVLADSPKASAALSRRCLQHLLREKAGMKARELSKQIDQVIASKSLPSHLTDGLNAVREIGNFAAHTMKSTNTGEILDVEPGEAEWSLDILESLFDHYFVAPAAHQARTQAFNTKVREAGRKPLE